jgi:hypothetical protein
MPQRSIRRQPAPVTASPETPLAPEEPPAANAEEKKAAESAAGKIFRVGEYEVGEVFCAHLCGHPEIRY